MIVKNPSFRVNDLLRNAHCLIKDLQWPTNSGKTEADVKAHCEDLVRPFESIESCQDFIDFVKEQCADEIQVG